MGKLMYSCEQAAKLSSQAMEEPLGPLDRTLLKLHLVMCSRCTEFSRQIAFLRRASLDVPKNLDEGRG